MRSSLDETLVAFCQRANCWVINNAAMERILFDGCTAIRPASFPRMRDTVVTVDSASTQEYVRFIFANEPVDRLREVGQRVRRALP